MESSQTRDQTCVPCIGRWILSHCTTKKSSCEYLEAPLLGIGGTAINKTENTYSPGDYSHSKGMPDTQSDFLLLILFCILEAGNHFILSLCILKETMYLFFFLAVLGLCCCRASPLVVASRGYCLTQWTGFSLQQLLLLSVSSRMHRLNSCGAWLCCSAACGILLDQGSNLCLLHWQVESLPPSLQGSPYLHL